MPSTADARRVAARYLSKLAVAPPHYTPFKVGTVLLYRAGTGAPPQQVKVTGYDRRFTEYGPEFFVYWYKVEDITTGEQFLVHPKMFHHEVKWVGQTPYERAFNLLTKALRAAGLLSKLKREAGHRRGELGYRRPYSDNTLTVKEVVQGLLRSPSISSPKAMGRGTNLRLEVPVSDTDTKPYTIEITNGFKNPELLEDLVLRLGVF